MNIERLTSTPPAAGEITENVEELLDRIDTSLMKRGTLNAATIDWQQVRNDSVAVLNECLHLLALRGLVFSLCQSQTEEDMIEAQKLLAASFATTAWNAFHPQDAKAERRRKQWGTDVLLALLQVQKQIDLATRGLPQEVLVGAQALAKLASDVGVDSASYAAGLNDLRQRGQATAKHAAEVESASTAPSELDAKGRAELRRDIRALAERISRHEPASEIPFLMRRYAGWLEFRTLPSVDSQGRVPQQPMPANIADEFRAAAERPTDNTLTRLEERLFNSPDWFEGHRLAAKMAQALGYSAVAEAIHERLARRLTDLPGLAGLRYANDTPYVDSTIADWAKTAVLHTSQETSAGSAKEEVAEPSLKDRIAVLETTMAARRSKRARAVAKLALAQELSAAGLSSHAQFLLQELSETLSEPVLASWDNELADEVRSALGRLN